MPQSHFGSYRLMQRRAGTAVSRYLDSCDDYPGESPLRFWKFISAIWFRRSIWLIRSNQFNL